MLNTVAYLVEVTLKDDIILAGPKFSMTSIANARADAGWELLEIFQIHSKHLITVDSIWASMSCEKKLGTVITKLIS